MFWFNREVLGTILDPAEGECNKMSQWVLKAYGNVVSRCTVHLLHVDEPPSPPEVKKRETFHALIERRWGSSAFPPPASMLKFDNDEETWDEYHDLDEPA